MFAIKDYQHTDNKMRKDCQNTKKNAKLGEIIGIMDKTKIDDLRHESFGVGKLFKSILNSLLRGNYDGESDEIDELIDYDCFDDDD